MKRSKMFGCLLAVWVSLLVSLPSTGATTSSDLAQRTWSVPVEIPTASNYHNDIAVDRQRTVHVVFEYSNELYHTYKLVGEAWSSRVMVGADRYIPYDPELFLDAADNLHVVWSELLLNNDYEAWYNWRPVVLGGWETPRNLAWSREWREPSIDQDSTGALHVVGASEEWPEILQYCVKPEDSGWLGPTDISGTYVDDQQHINLAVGPDDALHVVYNHDGLTYVTRPAGGVWSEPVLVGPPEVSRLTPRLYVDSANTIHVVWGSRDLTALLYMSKDPGMDWTEPTSIPGTTAAGYVDMAADAREDLHIIWDDYGTTEMYYIWRQASSGTWSERQTLTAPDPEREGAGWPHIAVGPDGALHATWGEDYEIMYTTAEPPFTFQVYLPLILRDQ